MDAGGHLCASLPSPHPSPCQSHRVCCHDVPSGEAPRPSTLPPCRAFFVSLCNRHNVHLCPPLLISYQVADNANTALPGCLGIPWVTPGSLSLSSSPFFSLPLSEGESCWQLLQTQSCSVCLFGTCYDGPSNVSHTCLLPEVPQTKKNPVSLRMRLSSSIHEKTAWEPFSWFMSVCRCGRTYNMQLPRHLL